MAYSKIARALPTRPDIKELQYSGARFSRGAIARLGQQLQSRVNTLDRIIQIMIQCPAAALENLRAQRTRRQRRLV